MTRERKIALIIFMGFFIFYGLCTHHQSGSWNDRSRMATVESLVERGTLKIDDCKNFPTGDKVMVNGHIYSDKLPNLSLIAAGIYWVFFNAFKISFEPLGGVPYFLLTWFIIGFSSSIMQVLFYKLMREQGLSIFNSLIMVITLGGGTLLFSYATTFNAHSVQGFLLTFIFYSVLKAKRGFLNRDNKIDLLLILTAFAQGLSPTIEAPSGTAFLLIFGSLLMQYTKNKEKLLLSLPAFFIPLIIHFYVNYQIYGDFKPSYMHPEAWKVGHGMKQTPENFIKKDFKMVVEYAFHSTLGKRGFFSHTPVLMLALVFLFIELWKNNYGLRKEAIAVGLGSLMTMGYHFLKTTSYGGVGFGTRYFISLTPLLHFFLFPLFSERKFAGKSYILVIFGILTIFSFLIAIIGAKDPWPNVVIPIVNGESY